MNEVEEYQPRLLVNVWHRITKGHWLRPKYVSTDYNKWSRIYTYNFECEDCNE